MNALVLGVQQLVTTLRFSGSSAAGIDHLVAAQEAMATKLATSAPAAANSTVNGLTELTMAVMAMVVAAMPKPNWQEHAKPDGLTIPTRYEPKALEAYFSKRPLECLSRNIKVSCAGCDPDVCGAGSSTMGTSAFACDQWGPRIPSQRRAPVRVPGLGAPALASPSRAWPCPHRGCPIGAC